MNKTYLNKSKQYESLQKVLITAGYPEIKYKDIEFVKTLLSKQNRAQLLTWAYYQISNGNSFDNSGSGDLLDDTKPILEPFLIENGFCRSNEAENFITGSNIKPSKEFQILKRIFLFITCNQLSKTSEKYADIEPFSSERLSEIFKKKHNVLPTHITPRQLSEDKKQIFYNEFVKENSDLEEKIRELENDLSSNENYSLPQNKSIEDLEQKLIDFEDSDQFKNCISNFTLVKRMNKSNVFSQNVNELTQQSTIIHDALNHVNNLLKVSYC